MDINYIIVKDENDKTNICEDILKSLPEWFGIPAAVEEYCENVKQYLFISARENSEPIGFISVKANNEYTDEIYVMGIKKEYHGKGIGKKLIETAILEIKENNNKLKYLLVKTLDESRECEEYAKTRLFYEKVGFIPIDVIKEIWGKENPCLLLIKDINK